MVLALIILGVLATFALAIAIPLHGSVHRVMRSPDTYEDAGSAAELIGRLPEAYRETLESKAFRFTKAYAFHDVRFGVWLQISPDPPMRVFHLVKPVGGGSVSYEFITVFSDDASLRTTTSSAAFLFPAPFGAFAQSFPSHSADALWRDHLRGEEHMLSALSIPVRECRLSFLEAFKRSNVRIVSHVTSIPFWVVRGVYWYSIKRFLLHNKPIWQQNIEATYSAVQPGRSLE